MANALSFTIVGVDEGSKVFVKFANNVDKAAKDVDKSSSKFSSAGKKAGTGLKDSLIGGVGLGLGSQLLEMGLSAASSFFGSMNQEAREAQKVGAQTGAVLKSTGQAAGVSAEQVGKLAESISRKTGIDDEQIQSAENMLLTFTQVKNQVGKGNDVFDQATQVITDLSVATGKDMVGAATMVGKALNDPIKGITALTRVGVTFTDGQKAQITAMAESGNVMGAQKIILAELTKEFGGSAEAQATAGDKISVAFANLAEQAGTAALPAIDALANTLAADVIPALSSGIETVSATAQAFSDLPGPVKIAYGGLAAIAVGAPLAAEGIGKARDLARSAMEKFRGLGNAGRFAAIGVGAAGAALGIATIALVYFAQKQAESKARVEALTETLDQQSGALTGLSRKALYATAQEAGLADQAEKAGISQKTLLRAIEEGGTVLDGVQLQYRDYINAQIRAGMSSTEGASHINKFNGALTDQNSELGRSVTAWRQQKEAGVAAAGTQGELKTSIDETTLAAQEQAEALQELIDNLTKLTQGALDVSQAEIGYQKAIDDATASIKDNGKTLDINTEKGRANRGALNDIADATTDLIESKAKQGATEAQLQRIQDGGIVQFYKQARAMGATKAEADRLTKAYFGIPGSRLTKLTADKKDADAKIRSLNEQLNRTRDKKTITKIKADIKQAQERRRQIQKEINSLRGKTIPVRVTGDLSPLQRALRQYRPSFVIPVSGQRAAGGPVSAGAPYLVGEKGMEVFVPKQAGTIIPNNQLGIQRGEPTRLPKQMPRPGGPWSTPAPSLVIDSGGSRLDDLLVEVLRRSIKARGGNVQLVLGQAGR